VADPPVGGLAANAAPDPADLPNNHLAYAGQWFFFALTALVIYVLALRRRRR
jgi:surfeit locus 1 family protein